MLLRDRVARPLSLFPKLALSPSAIGDVLALSLSLRFMRNCLVFSAALLAVVCLGSQPAWSNDKKGILAKKPKLRPTQGHFRDRSPAEFRLASPQALGDLESFKTSTFIAEVDAPRETVFESYLKANPMSIWNQPLVRVRAIYVPSQNRTLYRSELKSGWTGIEQGMKIFLDMTTLPLIPVNQPAVMVGIEIAKIDHHRKVVDFVYLEGSPPYGRQRIEFHSSGQDESRTVVRHDAWFLSHHRVVERVYPIYHELMLSSLHRKHRRLIEGPRWHGSNWPRPFQNRTKSP